MEHWEFLIQKQGDRSWLPLESAQVEILEGRYRLVARSSRANTDVEVRVTHTSTQEVPPKRRIQKRSRRTNSEGLMVVIPFTYLKPGIWELRCSGDLLSEFLGQSWQQSVQLQVSPVPANVLAEPEPKTAPTEIATPATAVNNTDVATEPPVIAAQSNADSTEAEIEEEVPDTTPLWLKANTAEQILQSLIDLALPQEEPTPEEEKVVEAPAAILQPGLLLTLDQASYVASWGQSLTLSGRVEAETVDWAISQTLYALEVRIELRNPQRSQLLAQVRQPLPEQLLPFSFTSSVAIPVECESKLILADIYLYGALAPSQPLALLATQPFTITADVSDLLGRVAEEARSEVDLFDLPLEELLDVPTTPEPAKPVVSIDLEFFNLAKTPKPSQTASFKAAGKNPLPAQLHKRSPEKITTFRPLELPKFSQPQINTGAAAANDSTPSLEADSPIDASKALVPYQPQQPVVSEQPDTQADEDKAAAVENDGIIAPADSKTKVDAAFQSLNMQQRFWTRLNVLVEEAAKFVEALKSDESDKAQLQTPEASQPEETVVQEANEPELMASEAAVERQSESAAVVESLNENNNTDFAPHNQTIPDTPSPQVAPPPRYVPRKADWLAQEIVVDDADQEQEPPTFIRRGLPVQEQLVSGVPIFLSQPSAPLEPLPIPELEIPKGDLIAGYSVKMRVQLPTERPRLAIKMWIQDCQTRLLLDGPHWLRDLTPNGLGGLETETQLTIPLGCLEIRIEAIAVDMGSQQESHKVTIERAVIPPDLPTLELELDKLLDG